MGTASDAVADAAGPRRATITLSLQQQVKEWGGDVSDSDDDKEEPSLRVQRAATEAFSARERRLSISAEALKNDRPMGDKEVLVLPQEKEWAGAEDSEEEDEEEEENKEEQEDKEAEEMGGKVSVKQRRHSVSASGRERRMTIGLEQLQKEEPMGDKEIEVVAETKEWAAADDSDDDKAESQEAVAETSFQKREKRLTVTGQALEKLENLDKPMGDTDVEVVQQNQEWNAAVPDSDDNDEEPGASVKVMRRRHSVTATGREQRMSVALEQLQKQEPMGDMEVEVVQEAKEWAAAEDSDDEKDTGRQVAATTSFNSREKRLTVTGEALQTLQSNDKPMGDTDIEVVQQDKEWDAEVADSDDENLQADATQKQESVQRRESVRFNQRERRLTVSADVLKLEQPIADAEVTVVQQDKEWSSKVEDSDDEMPNERTMSRRHSSAYSNREKRLSVGAEAMELMNTPDNTGAARGIVLEARAPGASGNASGRWVANPGQGPRTRDRCDKCAIS